MYVYTYMHMSMYISHSPTEAHCPVDSACLNQKIEAKTVKNLRVVVTVTRVSAEKERTKKKMKNWPVDVCACMYVCMCACMYVWSGCEGDEGECWEGADREENEELACRCVCMYVCMCACMYEVVVTLTRVSAEKERAKKHTCHYVYTI
jgi:hypothetical protein